MNDDKDNKTREIAMSDLIVNTTDANFDQDVLQSDLPVLVDFGRRGVALVKPSRLS